MSRKKRILIVDDQAIYREPMAVALEANGYKTVCAKDDHEAMFALQSNPTLFELILLDYSMPGMNGITFLEEIRKNVNWSEIPVVILTDVAEKELVLKARELRVREYLVKANFSLDELLRCVEKCTK
ncbi:MAG: response regulator [Bdellovibrionota bacterium]